MKINAKYIVIIAICAFNLCLFASELNRTNFHVIHSDGSPVKVSSASGVYVEIAGIDEKIVDNGWEEVDARWQCTAAITHSVPGSGGNAANAAGVYYAGVALKGTVSINGKRYHDGIVGSYDPFDYLTDQIIDTYITGFLGDLLKKL